MRRLKVFSVFLAAILILSTIVFAADLTSISIKPIKIEIQAIQPIIHSISDYIDSSIVINLSDKPLVPVTIQVEEVLRSQEQLKRSA